MIDGNGQRRAMETSDGFSAPARFKAERGDWLLEQDDDWFYAAVCGIGCMGIVLSCVLGVRERFRLTERREPASWAEVKEQLEAEAYRDYAHYEFYINVNSPKRKDQNKCIVTTRVEDADQ